MWCGVQLSIHTHFHEAGVSLLKPSCNGSIAIFPLPGCPVALTPVERFSIQSLSCPKLRPASSCFVEGETYRCPGILGGPTNRTR